MRTLLTNRITLISALIVAAIVIIAITGKWIAPYGINDVNVPDALQSPSGHHWFGTDELGRDILSRVLVATQSSLQIAFAAVAFAFVAGRKRYIPRRIPSFTSPGIAGMA